VLILVQINEASAGFASFVWDDEMVRFLLVAIFPMRRGHEVLQFSCQGNTCLCHISSSDLLPLPVARFLCYRTRKTFLLNKRTPTIHWHPYQVLAIFPAWILCLWRWCAGEIFEDASFPFDLPPFNCKFIL